MGIEFGIATVHSIELSEVEQGIRFETLVKVADAFGCDLVYALISRKPLAQSYEKRALTIALEQI